MRIVRFIRIKLVSLFKINDSPQRVALGFGLGVFLGLLPGTGPIAALVLAGLFRVNRASALLGSLLTNTWLSLVTIVLSIKLGSVIMGKNWEDVYAQWRSFLGHFQWRHLLEAAFLDIAAPVALGYLIVGFMCAAAGYLMILAALMLKKRAGNFPG